MLALRLAQYVGIAGEHLWLCTNPPLISRQLENLAIAKQLLYLYIIDNKKDT